MQDARKVVVDGNDGTGKTTLVTALRGLGLNVSDRGLPTKATDSDVPLTAVPGEVYVVLDCAPETSQRRLAARGADLTEEFHTLESLRDYRERFRRVAVHLDAHVVDAEGSATEVLTRVRALLGRSGSGERSEE